MSKKILYNKRSIGIVFCLVLTLFVSYLTRSSLFSAHGEVELKKMPLSLQGNQPDSFTIAIDGKAYAISETDEGVKLLLIKTMLPVYKAFGLSANKARFLYRPLNNGVPTGDLYVEDLSTGNLKKISQHLALHAIWSPTKESEVAYTFSSGNTFGLAIADLVSEDNRVIVPEQVFAEPIQWSDSGNEIYYFKEAFREQTTQDQQGEGSQTTELSLRLVSTTSEYSQEVSTMSLPKGFLAPQQWQFQVSKEEMVRGHFTAITYDDSFEISVDNITESSVIYVRALNSDQAKPVAEGRLLHILSKGILSKAYRDSQIEYEYTTFEGVKSLLATVEVASHNLPMKSFTLSQGGKSYPGVGNCRISTHTGNLSYAYDMQHTTNFAEHILASAPGLVVKKEESISCNSGDKGDAGGADCPAYDKNCTSLWGNYVIIEHASGEYTKYAHLQYNSVRVETGHQVCQGLHIANQGHTGNTCCEVNKCGDHLHFQLQESADLNGKSKSIDFADAPHPLSCGSTYRSNSNEVTSCSTLRLVTSLTLDPSKSIYNVGETVRGRFLLKNEGSALVTLDEWTIGGRRGGTPVTITDFPHVTSIHIPSGASYEYDDRFTFQKDGDYTFFPAYRIGSSWVTSEDDKIPYSPGIVRKLSVRAVNSPDFQLSLTSGWNLISLPLQPSDTAITSVLSSISGAYESVWAWNANTSPPGWARYPRSIGTASLTTMSPGRGYWIYMYAPRVLRVTGSTPSKTVQLSADWNLVGYNSTTEMNTVNALSNINGRYESVWAWNTAPPGWARHPRSIGTASLTTMSPGRGYWIYAKQSTPWTLP
jgi:murein DD-endopeptidase MepM/ murein hydrolase activator NlpD